MTTDRYIRVVNWEQFQHYKHRNPPWIKLYGEMLSSRTWVTLDDSSRVLAFAILMLAARHENKVPMDAAYIKRVAYLNSDPNFSGLVETYFIEIVDASNVLAPCPHNASDLHPNALPETETETEKRQREGARAPRSRSTQLPDSFQPNETHKRLALQLGVNLDGCFPAFCDYHKSKGSTFKEWDRALNTWLRRQPQFKHGGTNGNRAKQRQADNLAAAAEAKRDFGLVS
jgi:hypothetical protein